MPKRTKPTSITFAVAIEGYWLARRSNFSPHTVADYQLTFTRFAAYIGDTPLADITAADVQRFLEHVRAEHKLGKKTVNNIWIALSSFWTWAAVELHVPHIIRGHVRQPDYRPPVIETYTEVQIKAMLAACQETAAWRTRNGHQARTQRSESLRDQAIIVTLIDTGVRASELCNLEIRDYNQQTGRLLVRQGKGSKDRPVFLGQTGRRLIWRYLAERPTASPTDPLFPTNTNRPLERNNLRKTLQRIGERAGVTNVTIHRFRHTFAVTFLRNGGSLLELQEMLGHEKMETVRIYAKLAAADLQAAQRRASPADNWRL
jgi:integrase/recombinase XerD